ncbi:hypothetical protein [Nostoc sp.]
MNNKPKDCAFPAQKFTKSITKTLEEVRMLVLCNIAFLALRSDRPFPVLGESCPNHGKIYTLM